MKIELATKLDMNEIRKYDGHIPLKRLEICIKDELVYVLKEDNLIVGMMRYSLFWETIPFLDLIYIDQKYRDKGLGTKMMYHWEQSMLQNGYSDVMLSTQEDETAKDFYVKIGYKHIGKFVPPGQDVDELMFTKKLKSVDTQ